jgi:hypothetical protein
LCSSDEDESESQVETVTDDVFVQETCDAVHDVIHADIFNIAFYDLDRFRTWDLCHRVRTSAGKLPCTQELCHSCFNESFPPTCADDPDSLPPETIENIFDVTELWYFVRNGQSNPNLTLDDHLEDLEKITASHPMCTRLREAYRHGYWCDDFTNIDPTDPDYCRDGFCAAQNHTVDIGRINKSYSGPYNGTDQAEFNRYCRQVRGLYKQDIQFVATIELCRGQQLYSESCLCFGEDERGIAEDYLGADSTPKNRALVWMSRVSAVLPFLGAVFIMCDVFVVTIKTNTFKVYHQIVLGMAVYDFVTAVSWSFATFPINDENGYQIAGAQGTDASCKAQGFFLQLGFTSVFYNISLAMYYHLVVSRHWRESNLSKICVLLHGLPILFGLGLALGGLPFYQGFDYACHIQPHPQEDLWVIMVFVVCPIALSIVFVTLVMINLCRIVRTKTMQQAAAGASRALSQHTERIEKMVSWQALFYSLSFYITWPVVLLVYVTGWDYEKKAYGYSVLVSFVAPLQGFNNCLVYFRPRISKMFYAKQSSAGTKSSSLNSSVAHRSKARGGSESDDNGVEESRIGVSFQSMDESYNYYDPSIAIAQESIAMSTVDVEHQPKVLECVSEDVET